MMDKKTVLNKVEERTAEELAGYMRELGIELKELMATRRLDRTKREDISAILAKTIPEDNDYKAAIEGLDSLLSLPKHELKAKKSELRRKQSDLEEFNRKHPGGVHAGNANGRIAEIKETLRKIDAGDEEEELRAVMSNANEMLRAVRNDEYEFPKSVHELAAALQRLQGFVQKYGGSGSVNAVNGKIGEVAQLAFEDAIRNINAGTPIEFKENFGLDEGFLRELCRKIGIDYKILRDYDGTKPKLTSGDVPKTLDDIPEGFTDVFFWGIPSSGKTCALAAILNTIANDYAMKTPPIEKKFGACYRDNLMDVFPNGEIGFLPPGTRDMTQYMPFALKRPTADSDYIHLSFFELSGELFNKFYEYTNGIYPEWMTPEQKKESEQFGKFANESLDLLLSSDNRKIHFFFIDYSQQQENIMQQQRRLEAAVTFFEERNDIFKINTDAVYVVLTKADQIAARNEDERQILAEQFLDQRFKSFMARLQKSCETASITKAGVKIFSIGEVYFSKICKINRKYSREIIELLLDIIEPPRKGFRAKLSKFLGAG